VSQEHDTRRADERRPGGDEAGDAHPDRIAADEAARRATDQLAPLLGTEPERVIGVQSRNGGWRVRVEVLELERTPETTSVLASYDVDVDGDGELTGYRRTHRYARAQTDAGGPG
jgi:hypothetical protein